MEKHPQFWRIKALVHARGEAQVRATMAQHLAQLADAALATALKDAGFDPKGSYRLDDTDESISLDAVAGVTVE